MWKCPGFLSTASTMSSLAFFPGINLIYSLPFVLSFVFIRDTICLIHDFFKVSQMYLLFYNKYKPRRFYEAHKFDHALPASLLHEVCQRQNDTHHTNQKDLQIPE